MKKLLIGLMAVVALQVSAKELPPVTEMLERVNTSTYVDSNNKWEEKKPQQFSKVLDNGSVIIEPKGIHQFLAVTGNDSNELLISFSIAALQCAEIPMKAINQSQNKTLQRIMIENVSKSLKAPGEKMHTLAYGYSFDVTAMPGNGGVLLTCTFD